MRKKALITGITGQDGSLLAGFLLEKGYEVHGLRLYAATDDSERIQAVADNRLFRLHYGDMTDGGGLWRILSEIKPDEIYNLAAQSHVRVSFDAPKATADINALGTLRLLEAIRGLNLNTRFYQASSSEMFGNAPAPQNENTPFSPCSPYGAAKLYAYWIVRNYRDAYGIHASNGILFNHESPLRGEEFVTRKIVRAVAAIEAGRQECLALGNLNARRDWGHAQDYIEGMWLMLQQDKPDDYVLATGKARSVREFVVAAFAQTGINLVWSGKEKDEKGIDARTGRVLVKIDPDLHRPTELHELVGNAVKAYEKLGWKPQLGFRDIVREMIDAERAAFRSADGRDDRAFLAAE
ncbi:MAG: GDP-mannose 4,6-dehydratase [Proteobacteria bacterium]|nr:GDP-mannose 4,6-dehydratase [Pseudomonadota bacterium]